MISPVLGAALEAARPQLNRRIAEVRTGGAGFEAATLTAFLTMAVDPIAMAVAAVDVARVTPAVQAAIDVALTFGVADPAQASRAALLATTWQALVSACAPLIAADPARVLGMLGNAALHIDRSGGRSGEWRDLMAVSTAQLVSMAGSDPRVDTSSTVEQLAALGQLLAWRAGLAHFREGALAAGAALPESVAVAALGMETAMTWPAVAAALHANPWWGTPDADLATGAFTGLGGAFAGPPAVVPCVEGFFVDGRERHHLLIADRYGAVLHASSADEFNAAALEQGRHPAVQLDGSQLLIGPRTIGLDLPRDGLRAACNQHTVAVTSPYTHAIRLFPLMP
ncbi:hypothetical protein IP91_02302 [Pseudoduganella lurida]|uniref:Uncharacterized protein n=1 Tax=Pseudoduganella lurida TaxID=1036180 RepID=A0A562RBQ9_9BURK|nr:hypothetical protein IP91_02302 [Pseudoduganella lurida]